MADLLIYWRDYRNNREGDGEPSLRRWHSSSPLMAGLQPGDRLWLVTAGRAIDLEPAGAGFLVEVWTVTATCENPDDNLAYPRQRYRQRVLARIDPALTPVAPRLVDHLIRPANSSQTRPIGQLLQGPRRVAAETATELVRAAVLPDSSPVGASIVAAALDPDRPALGVRQPWVELILRGKKTIEVRSLETNIRGPIYLYASKLPASGPAAQRMIDVHRLPMDQLPRGLLVGTVDLCDCRPCRRDDEVAACVPSILLKDRFAWTLANPQRFETPVRPRFLPYGVWFYPFRRRNQASSP